MISLRIFLLVGPILITASIAFHAYKHFTKARTARTKPDPFGAFMVLGMLNFFVFWWVAVLSGGDALNGKIVGDAHFLGAHGQLTHVSFGFWLYSLTHTWATILSFPVMIVGSFVRIFTGKVDLLHKKDELHPRGRGTV